MSTWQHQRHQNIALSLVVMVEYKYVIWNTYAKQASKRKVTVLHLTPLLDLIFKWTIKIITKS